jgi:predicted nucleic acid-binding protein
VRRWALFDSSAILEVLFGQSRAAEVVALARSLTSRGVGLGASRLAEVECHRAALRVAQLRGGSSYDEASVQRVVGTFDLADIDNRVIGLAVRLRPFLKTLDSIHLATAQALGTRLEGLATLDQSMGNAARANGLNVLLP